MRKSGYLLLPGVCLLTMLSSCGNSNPETSPAVPEKEPVDSVSWETTSMHAPTLKKFKERVFDTLKVYYDYGKNAFFGQELTLEEAKLLPIGIAENYFGKLSGVYACCRFDIDENRLGLIARTPSEYESSSIQLFFFDKQKDRFLPDYIQLGETFGDAGDAFIKTSWLFKNDKNQVQSLVYSYSSYNHEVEDPEDHTLDEWKEYALLDFSRLKTDTLSTNEHELTKRFQRILKDAP